MPDIPESSFSHLSLTAKRRIDAILVRFERAWQTGRPRLEEFLVDLRPDEREALLTELLVLDAEYRRRAGEQPRAEDYLDRFPDAGAVVRFVFPKAGKTETAGGNTERNTASPGDQVSRPPPQVPGYEMLGELGRGGMGVVYKARHLALNRLVALKFILAGSSAPLRHRTRFRREAEVVARLHHPNIVQIYDIGEVDGQCFLALEYVEGGSVRERLDGTPMEGRNAARLLEPLARAVQHAHRQGIIHRDLKPANILLAVTGDSIARGNRPLPDYQAFAREFVDAPGVLPPVSDCTPKLTDFGLARMLDYQGPLSELGMAAGTPQYMAPEQALGDPNAGPAIDVWALGATLYELLTGRPPFRAATAAETLRLILDTEPVAPSKLQPSVPRDLETICLKCLEKEPAQRYPGPRELADDLQRFVDGEAIHARRVGVLSRLSKWAMRRPLLAGLAALLLVSLLAGLSGTVGGMVHVLRRWREAAIGEREAREGLQEQEAKAREAHAARLHAEMARLEAEEQGAWVLLRQAQDYGLRGDPNRAAQDLLAGLRLVQGQPGLDRLFRVNLAGWLAHVHALEDIVPVGHEVAFLARAKGGRLVVAGGDATIRAFDREGKPIGTGWKQSSPIRFLSLAEDGKHALVGVGDRAALLDLEKPGDSGMPLGAARVLAGILSADGKSAFTGGEDGVVRRWSETGKPIEPNLTHPAPVGQVTLTPDGRTLAVALRDKAEVWAWDLAATPPTHRVLPQPRPARALAIHPAGDRLWIGDADGVIRLVDARTGNEIGRPIASSGEVRHLGVTQDGMRLLSVASDHRVRLWDVECRQPIGTFRATTARLGADGAHLAVATPGEVRVYLLSRPLSRLAGEGSPASRGRKAIASIAGYPEEKRLLLGEVVTPRAHGLAWPRDVRASQVLPAPWRHRLATVPAVALSPNGKLAATISRQGNTSAVQAWDAQAGKRLFASDPLDVAMTALAIAPDGAEFATGDDTGTVRAWETTTGRSLLTEKLADPIRCLAYSPDGRTLAAGSARGNQGMVHFVDRKSRSKPTSLPHDSPVTSLAFAPDGTRLLVGGPVTTLLHRPTNRPMIQPVRDVTVSRLAREGKGVLVGTRDGQVLRFHASDGSPLPAIVAEGPIVALDLSSDGRLLLAATNDGCVRLWDTADRPALLGPPVVTGGAIVAARFRGDDRSFYTLTDEGTVRPWPAPRSVGGSVADVDRLVQVLTGQHVAANGNSTSSTAAEWRSRRKNLEPDSDLSASVIAWHDARADDAWLAGDLFAARWHLDRLLKLQDADRAAFRRRAVVLARLGLTDAARKDHERAAGDQADGYARELEYGLSRCQVVGDLAAARWYAEQLRQSLPKESWVEDEQAALKSR